MSICHVGENNGSLNVTIPIDIAKKMNLERGDKIYVDWKQVIRDSKELELLD